MIEVATIIECGSCLEIIKRYEKGFDGKIPATDCVSACPTCTAQFNWDGLELDISEAWVALQAWKAKTCPKATWESQSPMQFMARVKPGRRHD